MSDLNQYHQRNQAVFDASRTIEAMQQAGINPPADITLDGIIHRFASNGDANDKAGYYCLFDNGGGFFGCWRTGVYQTVNPAGHDTWSPDQRQAYREKIETTKAKADAQRKQEQEQAAKMAAIQWAAMNPAPGDHLYLKAKQIDPCGARADNYGNVAIPVLDEAGKIQSLQFIDRDGGKKFLPGGKVSGGRFVIEGKGDAVYICEGFATGASIHKATGCAVVVAFNAGNLKAVAVAIAKHYAGRKIVLAADNDTNTPGNPGITKGRAAADAIGASMVFPSFTPEELEKNPKLSDFNDFMVIRGLDAVKAVLTTEKPKSIGLTPDQTRIAGRLISRPPEPEFILNFYNQGLFKRWIVGVILAAGGIGKTYLMILLAWALSLGGNIGPLRAVKPLNVLLLLAEDDPETADIRLWDIGKGFYPSGLYVASVCGICGPLLEKKDGNVIESQWFKWLSETVKNHPGLDVLMIDPKSRFFGGEENSNDDNTRFIQCLEKLAVEHRLTVLFSHHVTKSAKQDGVSADMSRGGKALTDGVRWAAGMAEMSEATAGQYGIDDRQNYFSFEVVKTNYGAKTPRIWFRKDPGTGVPEYVNLDHAIFKDQAECLYNLLAGTFIKYSERELFKGQAGKTICDEIKEQFPNFHRKNILSLIQYGKREGFFVESENIPDGSGNRKKVIQCVEFGNSK